MKTVLDELVVRGFVQQKTDEGEIEDIFERPLTCYIGFDPTAESLHVGSLLPIMGLAHMQRFGHRAIALMGGATAMIGDPSGKDTLRKMMTERTIERNISGIKQQLSRYLSFDAESGILVNNADWTRDYRAIDFLRDFGPHFSVNAMLRAECFNARMEREEGLTFLELSYMLLQAYDFLHLFRTRQCTLQMGGDDQWSNILAGKSLIRKKDGGKAYGLTFPLIVTASGRKMGKTESGTVWLDAEKTPINDFYQYWRNTEDADVNRFMKFFTFFDVERIDEWTKGAGEHLNKFKSVLAFEITRLRHGREEAVKALLAEKTLFGISDEDFNFILDTVGEERSGVASRSAFPTTEISRAGIEAGVLVREVLNEAGLAKSLSEGKRLIKQGGVYVNGERIDDIDRSLFANDIVDGHIELRVGKKKYHMLRIV